MVGCSALLRGIVLADPINGDELYFADNESHVIRKFTFATASNVLVAGRAVVAGVDGW